MKLPTFFNFLIEMNVIRNNNAIFTEYFVNQLVLTIQCGPISKTRVTLQYIIVQNIKCSYDFLVTVDIKIHWTRDSTLVTLIVPHYCMLVLCETFLDSPNLDRLLNNLQSWETAICYLFSYYNEWIKKPLTLSSQKHIHTRQILI